MAKRTSKTRFNMEEAVEECTRRDSDQSGEDNSEKDSDLSMIYSEAEEMVLEDGDIAVTHDKSDSEWMPAVSPPAGKRPHLEPDSSSEEEPPSKTPQRGTSSRRRPTGRARGRARGRGQGSNSSGIVGSFAEAEESWKGVEDPDITPPQPTFKPRRSPGAQLIMTATYTALQLLQLFLTNCILQTIVTNTNVFGAAHHTSPNNPWVDITVEDMFSFISLVIYMGVVKCSSHTDYWRGGKLYDVPFPRQVMAGKKFLRICRFLHLSSTVADDANELLKGTTAFDRLCKVKPLYVQMRDACKSNYQPRQEISVDERMVASKSRISLKQYMKNKPVRWGYKLFVLADSKNGYTWDFFVYEGKNHGNSGKGLSYDSVMDLVDTALLGTGYKLFVDNFYTSPTLFSDLLQKKIWACGTIRTNRIGFPKTRVNALNSRSPRGSIRWLRKDSLLFVQWRDTREVYMCSSLHTAYSGDTVKRQAKGDGGQWQVKEVPVPCAVKDYNEFMGGVDLSDALISYYKVLHKTKKWYKTLFYHFLDIAIVNAFILHKEIAKGKGEVPMNQKGFRETLVEQLAEVGSSAKPRPRPRPEPSPASGYAQHRLVYITGDSTVGRRKCRLCHSKTPVQCSACGVPLCFVAARDCYNQWHVEL